MYSISGRQLILYINNLSKSVYVVLWETQSVFELCIHISKDSTNDQSDYRKQNKKIK
jgi:hypothetical protein